MTRERRKSETGLEEHHGIDNDEEVRKRTYVDWKRGRISATGCG
jgi:hypothetical protein